MVAVSFVSLRKRAEQVDCYERNSKHFPIYSLATGCQTLAQGSNQAVSSAIGLQSFTSTDVCDAVTDLK